MIVMILRFAAILLPFDSSFARENVILAILFLITVSVGPNLFVYAQAGYAEFSDLAIGYLIPSVIFFVILYSFISIPERRINAGRFNRTRENGCSYGRTSAAG